MTSRLNVISLGAGVQSTAMALMAAHGEIKPMPDCAIFADTQGEPAAVYDHLRWLMSPNVLPFPIHVVTQGDLGKTVGAKRPMGKFLRVDIPAYVKATNGDVAIIGRNCTRDYKIVPIQRKVRKLVGLTRKRSPVEPVVNQWIGISIDEASRMKPSRERWIENRWPLIEARMSRQDCLVWMRRNGYPTPPKSSCTFCPFHSDEQWKSLTPKELAEAVVVDHRLRVHPPKDYRTKGTLFLHRSAKPLDQVDFLRPSDWGQLDMFNAECEGMCGV